jgi:hypothetical protein
MTQFRFDVAVKSGGAAAPGYKIDRKIQKSLDVVFEANKPNQSWNLLKLDEDIDIMGLGFAAGDGAEDIQILDAHGPEFREMVFEGL